MPQCLKAGHNNSIEEMFGYQFNQFRKQYIGVFGLLLPLLLPLPTSPAMASSSCLWVSNSHPEALIQFGEISPLGVFSADLVWKGKIIRSLLMGQPNGYGSRWWAYEGKGKEMVGGGRLLTFRGNQPTRGVHPDKLSNTQPKQALLVGLGSDLYYTDSREDWDLIRAAEGFWLIPANCATPGRGGW